MIDAKSPLHSQHGATNRKGSTEQFKGRLRGVIHRGVGIPLPLSGIGMLEEMVEAVGVELEAFWRRLSRQPKS